MIQVINRLKLFFFAALAASAAGAFLSGLAIAFLLGLSSENASSDIAAFVVLVPGLAFGLGLVTAMVALPTLLLFAVPITWLAIQLRAVQEKVALILGVLIGTITGPVALWIAGGMDHSVTIAAMVAGGLYGIVWTKTVSAIVLPNWTNVT